MGMIPIVRGGNRGGGGQLFSAKYALSLEASWIEKVTRILGIASNLIL